MLGHIDAFLMLDFVAEEYATIGIHIYVEMPHKKILFFAVNARNQGSKRTTEFYISKFVKDYFCLNLNVLILEILTLLLFMTCDIKENNSNNERLLIFYVLIHF